MRATAGHSRFVWNGDRPLVVCGRVKASIAIDGHLDEAAWQEATAVSNFRQFEPSEGSPASQRTEVRVLYGADNLYIGATLHDDNPDCIEQVLGRRDEYNRVDWFLVLIDSRFDGVTQTFLESATPAHSTTQLSVRAEVPEAVEVPEDLVTIRGTPSGTPRRV